MRKKCLDKKFHLLLGFLEGGKCPAEGGNVEVVGIKVHVPGEEPHQQLVGVGAAQGVAHVATHCL